MEKGKNSKANRRIWIGFAVPFTIDEMPLSELPHAEWVKQLHQTLFFIGRVHSDNIEEIKKALFRATLSKKEEKEDVREDKEGLIIRIGGISYNYGKRDGTQKSFLRTLRTYVQPESARITLEYLRDKIIDELNSIPYVSSGESLKENDPKEKKYLLSLRGKKTKWEGHTTLVRFNEKKETPEWVSKWVEDNKEYKTKEFVLKEYHLYESTKEGYVVLQSFPLFK